MLASRVVRSSARACARGRASLEPSTNLSDTSTSTSTSASASTSTATATPLPIPLSTSTHIWRPQRHMFDTSTSHSCANSTSTSTNYSNRNRNKRGSGSGSGSGSRPSCGCSASASSSSVQVQRLVQRGYSFHAAVVIAALGLFATAVANDNTSTSTSTDKSSPKLISRRIPTSNPPPPPPRSSANTSADNSSSSRLVVPARAPAWLRDIANLSTHTYTHISDYYDMTDHLIFDALRGRGGVQSYYYFTPNAMLLNTNSSSSSRSSSSNNNNNNTHQEQASAAAHAHAHAQAQAQSPTPTPTPTPTLAPQSPRSPAGSIVPGPPSSLRAPSFVLEKEAWRAQEQALGHSTSRSHTQIDPARTYQRAGCESGEIYAVFELGNGVCGHRGIVHGGLTAALMDEVCGATTYLACGYGAFTANLNVNYIHPLPAEGFVLIRAHVDSISGRKTYVNVSVTDGLHGRTYANGRALFVRPKYMVPPSVLVHATQ